MMAIVLMAHLLVEVVFLDVNVSMAGNTGLEFTGTVLAKPARSRKAVRVPIHRSQEYCVLKSSREVG